LDQYRSFARLLLVGASVALLVIKERTPGTGCWYYRGLV
jgi:hypothetical protein